jgi:hypothetical protein
MTHTISSQAGNGYRQGRRARQQVPRTRRVEFTLTDEEHAVVEIAARQAGLATAAYAAKAALAAAAQGNPAGDPYRHALIELMRAAGLVRRIGTNLNQAVAKLTATGQPAGNLPAYATGTTRRADHIDAVAEAVRKALERGSRTRQR